MKIKTLLILIVSFFSSLPTFAHLVNNGANLVVNTASICSVGNFTNKNNGLIKTANANIIVSGNWTNSASNQTFDTGSSGTVTLNGTNQTISGTTTFPNLTKNVTTADTLTFSPGSSNLTTITGTTTFKGASGQYLSLRSSSTGTQWQFDPQGTRDFDFFDVQDSNNVNTTEINATAANKINSGNNTNWLFGDETYIVEFVSGGNGTLSGETTQTVVHGNDCTPVTANPDVGYTFANWTGDRSSTDNPFTVTNVRKNMTIQANFASSVFTVKFYSEGKGSVKGQRSQQVAYGGDCTEVIPVPGRNHHFKNWTGDYTGTDDPLTVTNVTSDMDITANFALDQFTVTFVEGANGSIDGDLVQVIDFGSDTSKVTAVPDATYSFVGWTGDYSDNKNPLTITDVKSDMTINSNFQTTATIARMIPGSKFNIDQSEVTGISQFTRQPRVDGLYYDPVKDPEQLIDKTPNARCLSNPTSKDPLTDLDFFWRKSLYLYDRKAFKQANNEGITCEDYLIANPIDNLLVSIYLKTSQDGEKYDQVIRPFFMTPPTITAIRNESDNSDITQATLDEIFIIKGTFFSRSYSGAPPDVWLEFKNSKNQVRRLRLTTLSPYKYTNAKGIEEKSCMNVNTGVSEIKVQMPSRWPRGWDLNADHNIVIDNSVGLATAYFSTY